jgi:hypothetical protein
MKARKSIVNSCHLIFYTEVLDTNKLFNYSGLDWCDIICHAGAKKRRIWRRITLSKEKENSYRIISRKLLTRIGIDRDESQDGEEDADRRRLVSKTDRLLDTLNRMGDTMEKVADIQLKVVEKLLPIVENLGQLVRHSLHEVSQKRRQIVDVDHKTPDDESSNKRSND